MIFASNLAALLKNGCNLWELKKEHLLVSCFYYFERIKQSRGSGIKTKKMFVVQLSSCNF